MVKMLHMARELQAKLFGDDGEEYTIGIDQNGQEFPYSDDFEADMNN